MVRRQSRDVKEINAMARSKCIGVDGTKGGWLAVLLDADDVTVNFYKAIDDLCAENADADIILIDIPIGLPEKVNDERPDAALRKVLKGKTSSVFNTPCRQAVYTEDYDTANGVNRENVGKGLSKQSFAISGKIKEVDNFLTKSQNMHWRERLVESHPEYGFSILNGGRPVLENKKTESGIDSRYSLLSKHLPNLDSFYIYVTQNAFYRSRVDDVLDALCLAVIGRFGLTNGFRTIPGSVSIDSKGLKMQIVYGVIDEPM